MKHLILTFSLLAIVSCKDNKQQDTKTETVEHATETHNEHHEHEASSVYANAWTNDILLNNGSKWQADKTTNEGVQKIQNTINTHTASTLEEFHKLAQQLNDKKNYVVKNCSMEGPSHDNLHVWLHPLIEKINALLKVETVEDASRLEKSIKENVNAYSTYFQ
ncbi:hypothetical protein [Oceanihabitans sediminis]|uniref:hypothetical protein n=1 Tax=Oceanihabitans sediminis TaxID=1812012 RepID=UPI003A8FB72F